MPTVSPYLPRRGWLLRRSGAAVLVTATVLAAGGCAKFDATFGQQEAVVHFRSGTSAATRLHVRAACSHIANVVPEPLPTDHILSDELNNVRYQVGGASDAEQAQLAECLSKFPSVTGIDTPSGQ